MPATTEQPAFDDGHSAMLMLSLIMLTSVFAAGLIVGATLF